MDIATFIVAVIVFGAVAAIIITGVRNRKKGKSSCGCACSGCAMADTCHSKEK